MANKFIKAEKVVKTTLALLEREIVLPRMVWRDAVDDFTGAYGDKVTIRLPAYTKSRKRPLRGGRPIITDQLAETKVDVGLDSDIYKAVSITDEELTLDITSFAIQVAQPVAQSVARGVEDELALTMSDGDYAVSLEVDPVDPYNTLVDARTALNNARVPMSERGLVVGSAIEAALLKSDHLSRFDQAGDNSAFRDAIIGRIAGFTAVSAPGLDPDKAYAFHRTAYTLATRAPVKPDGVTWGASESFGGIAMRSIRDYDFDNVQDRLLTDTFMGSSVVKDLGFIDEKGRFEPAQDPDESGAEELLVRAVELVMPGDES